ncbi:MAG TPA: class I SAM-dependent methyltransferase [Gemmatimonadaceae bacterium]|nr:class I SAM-dependent methyltransferase [Gemmatimonadaceae bacterium]
MANAEDIVSRFYNTVGWESEGEITEDARRWEDLREHATEYVSRCRLRVLRHIPSSGSRILDMASGPIQYDEYLEFSRNFEKRYCVDLSTTALEKAKKRIGDHGVFLKGSFFDLPMEESFFDCAISLHTIYHMDRDRQEEAVRKLIHVTRPGKPVVIVYANPDTLVSRVRGRINRVRRNLGALRRRGRMHRQTAASAATIEPRDEEETMYFFAHPLEWWKRFEDVARVKIFPWRAFDADTQKQLIPNNSIGRGIFDLLFKLEERFPDFFARHFEYPIIVLTRNS